MRRTWTQIKNETMTEEERRHAHMLAVRDLAEMELAELREALQVSQAMLAKKLKVTQVAISRLERRPNVLLESIANYVEALGGKLELYAVLPNRTVKLTHLLSTSRLRKNHG
jgi:DNA-binding transcriptional regulator YiaG